MREIKVTRASDDLPPLLTPEEVEFEYQVRIWAIAHNELHPELDFTESVIEFWTQLSAWTEAIGES